MTGPRVEFIPGRPHRVELVGRDGTRETVWQGDGYMDAMAEAQDRAKALGCAVVRTTGRTA